MVQEHWLSEQQLPRFEQLNAQFFARSGMEDAISAGVFQGRPFGGVSICWSKNLNHVVTPISNYKHKRIVAVELKSQDRNLLLISAYMPYFNASGRNQCINETLDALSVIELLISDHPNHDIIIGGDLNTELKGDSPFDIHWNELMNKNSLRHCDSLVSSIHYTYCHESLNQKKFNDHFVVSESLFHNGRIGNHFILDDGDNPSDHLPLLLTLSLSVPNARPDDAIPQIKTTINWKRLSVEELSNYSNKLEQLLLVQDAPSFASGCVHKCGCKSDACRNSIQREYDNIKACITNASSLLPKTKTGVEKDWWTAELTNIRNQSIDIQSLWIQEGRPRHGPTYLERLRVRAQYKRCIREAKRAPKQAAWNKLHSAMETRDTNSFWKWWRSVYGKNKSRSAPVVDGNTSKEGIADTFKNAFQKNSVPNNAEKVKELNDVFKAKYEEFSLNHAANCDCDQYVFSLEDTFDAINSMKQGKSPDDDGLNAEHFLNGPLVLFIKLTSLFNCMLKHAFVPADFRFGTIVPIIKDRFGNTGDVSNYRGITMSPMISKAFEHALKQKFTKHFSTSSYQFGFKSKSSTSHALYCLKETINYYIDHGSRVFCSFLDASKAFDRLVHSGLFSKLIDRKAPKCLLDILVTWYNGLMCRVRWDGHLSDWFLVTAGVRQGGVLSPDLYNIYVDDLIHILRSRGIGCHVASTFAAALFYADDMCILAPSMKGLQKMLIICGEYCEKWDIGLNAKKTKNMFFGKKLDPKWKLKLNGAEIDWVPEWKYLGVTLKSGVRFGCSVKEKIQSFYRSLNGILRVEGRSDDLILLGLIESHCIPILTYGMEIIHVAQRDERRSLRVAYNSVFRKIFGYRVFESVTNLQHALKRQTWEELIDTRSRNFLRRLQSCPSGSLVRCFC